MADAPVVNTPLKHTTTKTPMLRWWYMGFPLLGLCAIAGMDRVAIAVIMANKQFLTDLSLIGRPAVTGLLMSGFIAMYAASSIGWGYFVRRFGPRIAGIIGVILWGLTMGASGLAHTAGALITARVVLGLGEGFMFSTCNTYVVNWFPPKERGTATSMYLNGQTIGPILAGVLVVWVIGSAGWRMAFFALGALSLIIPLPLLIFPMKDRPRQQRSMSKEEITFIEQASLVKRTERSVSEKKYFLRNYRFWLLVGVWCSENIYYYGWLTWMPTYFQNARHFSFHAAGYLFSLNWAFTLVTILGIGYLSDRFLRRAPFGCAGFFIAGIAMYLGGSVIQNNYWALAALVISLASQQPANVMMHALFQTVVPAEFVGASTGVAATIGLGVGMVAPFLAGLFLQLYGFGAVIALFAVAPVLSGLLLLILAKEGY